MEGGRREGGSDGEKVRRKGRELCVCVHMHVNRGVQDNER